jgi:hypothetical protein
MGRMRPNLSIKYPRHQRETPFGTSIHSSETQLGTAILLKQLSVPNCNVFGASTLDVLDGVLQLSDF